MARNKERSRLKLIDFSNKYMCCNCWQNFDSINDVTSIYREGWYCKRCDKKRGKDGTIV